MDRNGEKEKRENMKINGMDYLNSFHGCQVIEYRMVKRFKGQLEGKNRYLYGVIAAESAIGVVSMILLFDVFFSAMASRLISHRSMIVFLICVAALFVVKIYYERNSFMTAEYHLRIDDGFPEEEFEKIRQDFYLHPAVSVNKKKPAENVFIAYPKLKGELE